MARKQRYHSSGAFYHVMLRGNDGQVIFCENDDRFNMGSFIQQGVEKYRHRIHAFCFMPNHIHLLIQVGVIPLSKIIHNLAFRYTQYFNHRHNRIGHLFQGRFKAIIIEESSYFLRVLRYIHMNPVRASLVPQPDAYFWSGHRAYLNQIKCVWLTVEYGLAKFSNYIQDARIKYRDYVLQQETPDELKQLRNGFDGQILGDDSFLDDLKKTQENIEIFQINLETILNAGWQVYKFDLAALGSASRLEKLSLARGAIITFATENGYTVEGLAKIFNRDGSSAGRLKQSFAQKRISNVEIQKQYQLFEQTIRNLVV